MSDFTERRVFKHASTSAPITERGNEVEIVEEVDHAVGVEIGAGQVVCKRINKVEVIEKIDGAISVEVGTAGWNGRIKTQIIETNGGRA